MSTETLNAGRPSARAMEAEDTDSTLTSATCDNLIGPSAVAMARFFTSSTEPVESPTWTASSRVLSNALPAGITWSCACTVWETTWAVMSWSVRSLGRSVMFSWVVSSPVTLTCRTPSIALRSGTATFWTSRPDSASGRSVETASSSTGMSSVLPVRTSVLTVSGMVGATESTALRMLPTTLSSSRP